MLLVMVNPLILDHPVHLKEKKPQVVAVVELDITHLMLLIQLLEDFLYSQEDQVDLVEVVEVT